MKGQLQEDAITFTFGFSNHASKVNSNGSGFIHKAESEDLAEQILIIGCFKPDYSMHSIAICDKITYGATAHDNLRDVEEEKLYIETVIVLYDKFL